MTNDIASAVDRISKAAEKNQTRSASDYEENGILICGVCGEPKQVWSEWDADMPIRRLVHVMCSCDAKREAKENERRQKEQFLDKLRKARAVIGSGHSAFVNHSFDEDDDPENNISQTCRRYVEHWEQMKESGTGVLIYGSKGTGKSFYASCVANALADKGVLTGFTTIAELVALLQEKRDRQEIMDTICRFELLVLDDLGAERETSFGAETAYNIINARYRTGRPTIVTTNFDLPDMESETELWRSRINDRVIEMCPIAVQATAESRRSRIRDEKRHNARLALFPERFTGNAKGESQKRGE